MNLQTIASTLVGIGVGMYINEVKETAGKPMGFLVLLLGAGLWLAAKLGQ